MVSREVSFGADSVITPDFAAKLAQQASAFSAEVFMENGNARLCVDSLIGILAMDMRRGMRIRISAEGADEEAALERIATLLESGV